MSHHVGKSRLKLGNIQFSTEDKLYLKIFPTVYQVWHFVFHSGQPVSMGPHKQIMNIKSSYDSQPSFSIIVQVLLTHNDLECLICPQLSS